MSNYTTDDCPGCGSTNLIRQTGNDEPTLHYGRLKCKNCGKHIQWLRDPGVSLQWQFRADAIDKILSIHNHLISQWERGFLQSVREQRNLSPRQRDRLNAVGLRCLGMHICASDTSLIKNAAPDDSRGVGVH
jgi:transcription elongation factor Elf1